FQQVRLDRREVTVVRDEQRLDLVRRELGDHRTAQERQVEGCRGRVSARLVPAYDVAVAVFGTLDHGEHDARRVAYGREGPVRRERAVVEGLQQGVGPLVELGRGAGRAGLPPVAAVRQ